MIHATVNHIPVPSIVVHNVTYVEVSAAERALGIVYSCGVSDTPEWSNPTSDNAGIMFDGNVYAAWNTIARNVYAHKTHNGWEFDTFDNVMSSTPILMVNDTVLFETYAGTSPVEWQLDTGASECLIGQSTADELHLPNLGYVVGSGVGGTVEVYKTVIPQITIGQRSFSNVPAVVDPSWTSTNLFGWQFFFDNNYSLIVDHNNFTLDIVK